MKEALVCRHGNHSWSRERTRGKKPHFCPKHQPSRQPTTRPVRITDAGPVEILHCTFNGHEWERTRTRGKKPHFCPEHAALIRNNEISQDDLDHAGGPSSDFKLLGEGHSHASEVAAELLTGNLTLDEEFRRKLTYCQQVLSDPKALARREDHGGHIEQIQKDLLREWRRRWPQAAKQFDTQQEMELS